MRQGVGGPYCSPPTGNMSLYHHLVGTLMYCSMGEEKCSTCFEADVEEATVGGERPLVVPLFFVFFSRAQSSLEESFLEEVTLS